MEKVNLSYISSKYIEKLREITEMYKQGRYTQKSLKEPLIGCYVCAKIANVKLNTILEFCCDGGHLFFVHQECIDYLLDEAFLNAREKAVKKLRKEFFNF